MKDDDKMANDNKENEPREVTDAEAHAAQRQWIETGTVPRSYLKAMTGAEFSNRSRPFSLKATNFKK